MAFHRGRTASYNPKLSSICCDFSLKKNFSRFLVGGRRDLPQVASSPSYPWPASGFSVLHPAERPGTTSIARHQMNLRRFMGVGSKRTQVT